MYAKQFKVPPLDTPTSHLSGTYTPALYTNVVKHGLLQSDFFFNLIQVSTKINKTVNQINLKSRETNKQWFVLTVVITCCTPVVTFNNKNARFLK
jgi:hypothetical protein